MLERGIEEAAVRLLAAREHSRSELRRKLSWADSDALEEVLGRLAEQGLQSDARFAEQYVAMRIRRGYGPLRIRAELRERGVGDELIREFLPRDDELWRPRVEEAVRRKFGDELPKERRARMKVGRFLQYRGFPEYLIREFIFG